MYLRKLKDTLSRWVAVQHIAGFAVVAAVAGVASAGAVSNRRSGGVAASWISSVTSLILCSGDRYWRGVVIKAQIGPIDTNG